jgi:hypothetical protein
VTFKSKRRVDPAATDVGATFGVFLGNADDTSVNVDAVVRRARMALLQFLQR